MISMTELDRFEFLQNTVRIVRIVRTVRKCTSTVQSYHVDDDELHSGVKKQLLLY